MTLWQDDGMARYSPTARRRRLGLGLRSLRKDRGHTAEQAAKLLGMSTSQLTKIETAERNVSKATLMGVLSFYEADQKLTRELLELHATSRERGWFQAFGVQPGSYIDWESESVKAQGFEPLLVPGILQTEAYADAVIAAMQPGLSDDERASRARVRVARAGLLDEPDGPDLHYLVHEQALRTPVGGAAVMAEQLDRVAEMCKRHNRLTVQVVPTKVGAYGGMEGSFSILTFAELPALACVEHILSTAWFEKPSEVNTLAVAFGRIANQAMTSVESVKLIREIARGMS